MISVQIRYSVEAGLLLLGVCVLVGPLLAERFRIPGMVGLIAAGTILGPFTLAWLQPGGFVATLGAAGLLYLMFMAGVELDLPGFGENRTAAVVFGLATFVAPFALSWIVGAYVLGLGVSATALIGAMWASHTLVAYPEAKAAGIDRRRAVGVSLAATMITDVIALVVLAIATSSSALDAAPEVAAQIASGAIETSTTLPLWAGLILLVVVCFGVIPRATRWLFANLLFRRTERFVWTLVAMAAGAIAGLVGGIEGMVGAFLAGIGMNSSVPARSELMERIEFIGSALLIPAFLVSVGLSIDPVALVDPETLGMAALFTAIVLAGKTIAAAFAGLVCGFDRREIAVMASLTIGQAAATLAIAEVGVGSGLLSETIRNAAIVTVVVTVVVTSLGTRLSARRLGTADGAGSARIGDHVLVLAPEDLSVVSLYAVLASSLVRDADGLVTPFAVRTPHDAERLVTSTERLTAINDALVRLGHDTRPVHRVADTLPNGVGQLADEVEATMLVAPIPFGRPAIAGAVGDLDAISSGADVPIAAVSVAGTRWSRNVVLLGPPIGVDGGPADDLAREIALKFTAGDVVRLRTTPCPISAANTQSGDDPVVPASPLPPIETADVVVVPGHRLEAGPDDALRSLIERSDVTIVVAIGPRSVATIPVDVRPAAHALEMIDVADVPVDARLTPF